MAAELDQILNKNMSNFIPSSYPVANVDLYPDPVKNPSYIMPFDFETNFNFHEWRIWMGNTKTLPVYFAVLYVTGIYLGQKWMEKRSPYKIERSLQIWNFLLAIFSLMIFLRTIPEVVYLLTKSDGFHQVSCSREEYNVASAYWTFLGTLSKVVELGDTAFLVLRKRPVIFLHWYHHTSVMLYSWFTFGDVDPCHRWFTIMNSFIHTIMYTYFGLRAMGLKMKKNVSIFITSLQILQMVAGLFLNLHGLYMLYNGVPCSRKLGNVQMALSMYLSYMILFSHFFYKSYCITRTKSTKHLD